LRGAVAFDPLSLTAVAALLATAALVAAFVPARRALAVDPARALRAE
jgi:ABC-type lipoprotein release transport system permease subunit